MLKQFRTIVDGLLQHQAIIKELKEQLEEQDYQIRELDKQLMVEMALLSK